MKDDRIIIAVEGRGLYKAGKSQAFGDNARKSLSEMLKNSTAETAETVEAGGTAQAKIEQGRELYAFIPGSFHRLIKKRERAISGEGLVLSIGEPSLAEFAWEFVPIYDAGQSPVRAYWHNLPMVRTIPGSSHRERLFAERNVRKCFYNVGLLSDNIMAAYNINVDMEMSIDGKIAGLSKLFIQHLGKCDFMHIASHGVTGAFVNKTAANPAAKKGAKKNTPYYTPKSAGGDVVLPRVIIADCCHSAETGPAGDWNQTMPGAFIRKNGAAIYIGNLGKAYNGTGRTMFADNFIRLFLQGRNIEQPFVDIIYQVRQAQAGDSYNSQVVYVAADFDIRRPAFEILTAWRIKPRRADTAFVPVFMAIVCIGSLINQAAFGFDPVALTVSIIGLAAVFVINYVNNINFKKLTNGE